MPPPQRLKLLGRKITLSEALSDEDDVLQMLKYPKRRIELIVFVLENEHRILQIAAQHLNVKTNAWYLLLEYIEDGQTLYQTFDSLMGDSSRRQNLFKDLSRIMVSLAKIPQARIGSFTIDNEGFISLSNRPLTLRLQALENEGISTNIPRMRTYECTDSYALDLLAYHDSRLLCQPNSMNDGIDGRRQMSVVGQMRSIMPQFLNSKTKRGPFFFRLTDLHPSNIFVNEFGQITSLIDLEWACSHPVEMLRPPYWLTGQNVDDLEGANFEKFSSAQEEFMTEFHQQESLITSEVRRSAFMKENWTLGSFWYSHALESTKGLYNIFKQHIMPRFSGDTEFPDISQYCSNDTNKIIFSKLEERKDYLQQLTSAALAPDSDSDSDS
ncbi:hypothetical protein LTS17_006307 [Exophiala oligosperma]